MALEYGPIEGLRFRATKLGWHLKLGVFFLRAVTTPSFSSKDEPPSVTSATFPKPNFTNGTSRGMHVLPLIR
jgi:hypothetical protein